MSPGFPRADPVPLIAFRPPWAGSPQRREPLRGERTQSLPTRKGPASRRVALWAESGSARRRGGARSGTRAWAGPPPSPALAPGRFTASPSQVQPPPAAHRACTSFQIPSSLSPPDLGAEEHSAFLSLTIKIKQKYILSLQLLLKLSVHVCTMRTGIQINT